MRLPARIIAVLAGLALAAGAAAQTSRPASSQPAAPPAGLLAGPPVDVPPGDDAVNVRRDRHRTTVPPRRWFRMVIELDLDRSQRREIRSIVTALRREQREFQRDHAPRLRELRQEAGDFASGGLSVSEIQALQAERERLQALTPDVPATHQRIWELLTDAQQETFRTQLAEERKRIMAQRSDRRDDAMANETDERRRRFLESRRR